MPHYDQRLFPTPLPTASMMRQNEEPLLAGRPKKSLLRQFKEAIKPRSSIRSFRSFKKKLLGRSKKARTTNNHPYMHPHSSELSFVRQARIPPCPFPKDTTQANYSPPQRRRLITLPLHPTSPTTRSLPSPSNPTAHRAAPITASPPLKP